MGNLLITLFQLRCEYSQVPHTAILRARQPQEAIMSAPAVAQPYRRVGPGQSPAEGSCTGWPSSPPGYAYTLPMDGRGRPHDETGAPDGSCHPRPRRRQPLRPPVFLRHATLPTSAPRKPDGLSGEERLLSGEVSSGVASGKPVEMRDIVCPVEICDQSATERASNSDGRSVGENSMNPLDCVDAFEYYYGSEGTYQDMESAVFHAPGNASCTPQDLLDLYQMTWRPPPGERGGPGEGTSDPALWSVVDQLRLFCALHPGDPAVSWRSVMSYKYLNDYTTPPMNVTAAASSSQPPRRCLHYMGPSQYMTCGELWANIEAFGEGLRSLGLKPGDPLGLMEVTRWEWLVTCYACWSQGLVPVVFHGTDACLRQAAREVLLRTKVVVCQPHVIGRLRQYIREAVALHESHAGESEVGRPKGSLATGGADLAGPLRSKSTKPPRPLFVVMRQTNIRDAHLVHHITSTLGSGTNVVAGKSNFIDDIRSEGLSNRHHNPDESDEVEEPLWWTEVLDYGKKVLLQRGARQYHERQQRRSRFSMDRQNMCKHDEDDAIVKSVSPASRQTSTSRIASSLRRSVMEDRSSVGPWSSHSNTMEPLPTLNDPTSLSSARRHLAFSNGCSTSGLVPLRSSDLGLVVYTEGDPKGVLLTHGALAASVAGYRERFVRMQLLSPVLDEDIRNKNASRYEEGDPLKPGREGSPISEAVESHLSAKKYYHSKDETSESDRAYSDEQKCGSQGYSKRILNHLSAMMKTNLRDSLWEWLHHAEEPPPKSSADSPTYLAYLPLHNVRELVLEMVFLTEGFLLCYGSPSTLTKADAHPRGDLDEFKPLVFSSVPYTLDQLCSTVTHTLAEGFLRVLFELGYEQRRQALRRGLDTPFLNQFIFGQPRQLLGGRCQLVLSCGGPLHPRTQEYLKVVCGVAVSQVYAPTEAAGCGTMQNLWVDHMRNIGGPLGPVEMKLRDVKQWNHFAVRPCGELLLRGPTIMTGYHCNLEKTAAVLESSGWLHTGDIVERLPDGTFSHVARLGAQDVNAMGCIIDVESLEAVYSQHPLCVAQRDAGGGSSVCVLVHPFRSYICALVLTDKPRTTAFIQDAATQSYLARASRATLEKGASRPDRLKGDCRTRDQGLPLSWPHCLREPLFNEAAAESLRELAVRHHCMPHELVRHVRILYDEWTTQNGARTVTGRLTRSTIEQRYQVIIEELFLRDT
ncbi:unnamed protein product [Phytomonas sp. EM1]|nr:unnamed protein product [Phytomonas sp. EM1]|eukprot:CCW64187.1 unnamed protein product [Phytomonas sp. isolate EM1]